MVKAGKVIALCGAILGVLSLVLSVVLPEWFSWYRLIYRSGFIEEKIYLNGFGINNLDIYYSDTQPAMWVLVGSILILVGANNTVIGVLQNSKILGLIGGILMLIGPLLLLVEFLVGSGQYDFVFYVGAISGDSGTGLLWGSYNPIPAVSIVWGVWTGFYLAGISGVLALIGSALATRKEKM